MSKELQRRCRRASARADLLELMARDVRVCHVPDLGRWLYSACEYVEGDDEQPYCGCGGTKWRYAIHSGEQTWFDFKTNRAGDAVSWIQHRRGLSYEDAVAELERLLRSAEGFRYARRGEHLCGKCHEVFDAPVVHCPHCDHHWTPDRIVRWGGTCPNCHRTIGIRRHTRRIR